MNREWTAEDELRHENRRLATEAAELRVRAEAAEAWCESWKRGAGISSRERDEARTRGDDLAADLATCVRLRDQALAEVERLTKALTALVDDSEGQQHRVAWQDACEALHGHRGPEVG